MTRIVLSKALLFLAVAVAAHAQNPLPVPPLLTPSTARASATDEGSVGFEITAQESQAEFLDGVMTDTLGYSQDYLGPTIRVRRGQTVSIDVANELEEMTTVHWHGLHVPAESDGGPHQTIQAGERWRAEFVVDQSAATLWYHPHPMARTGAQVYDGLAGFLIIDDEFSESLAIPSTYGVDDIPLVLQDRRFDADGEFSYARTMPEVMHGFPGDYFLVNGAVDPVFDAPLGVVRLRILNGSDTNVMRIRFSDGRSFQHIASDGGFLAAPIQTDEVVLATGERAELLVETKAPADGSPFFLVVDDMYRRTFDAVEIRAATNRPAEYRSLAEMPQEFQPIAPPRPARRTPTREFVMSSMGPGGQLTINGRHMDIDRIDFRIPLGRTEIWEISNVAMGMMGGVPHTFHIHHGQYQLIDVNGESPPPELAGWKDTWLLWPGDRIRVLVRFDDYTGIYMYHCHFLVHEDFGMMGQFEVYEQ